MEKALQYLSCQTCHKPAGDRHTKETGTCFDCQREIIAAEPATEAESNNGLPANPEGMNNDRAKWAQLALDVFQVETGTEECDALSDLLCDLMHWAPRHGTNFSRMLERARRAYAEETRPDGDGLFD